MTFWGLVNLHWDGIEHGFGLVVFLLFLAFVIRCAR